MSFSISLTGRRPLQSHVLRIEPSWLYLYTYIEGTYRRNHNIDVDFIIIIFTEYRSTRLYIKYIAWNKLFFMFRVIQPKIIFHAVYYNMF